MMFNTSKKLKYSNGSAMTIVIVALALLLIFIPYMSKQVTNQLKSTMNSYNDIKEKYLAEAGIEKSILEIEKQIEMSVAKYNITTYATSNHYPNDDCDKVTINENGDLEWGSYWGDSGNTFYKLIYWEIIDQKSNRIYGQVLTENWKLIFNTDSPLRTYYENNIKGLIDIMIINHNMSELKLLETNINEFIKSIEDAKLIVESSQGTESQKKQAIDGYDQMIGYMEEIKCRLNMNSIDQGDSGATENVENKEIEIPYYDVTIDDNDNITFNKNNLKSKKYQIKINRKNGKVTRIDFTNINNTLICAKAYNYEIKADIDFEYIYKDSKYSIQKSINSYTKVN